VKRNPLLGTQMRSVTSPKGVAGKGNHEKGEVVTANSSTPFERREEKKALGRGGEQSADRVYSMSEKEAGERDRKSLGATIPNGEAIHAKLSPRQLSSCKRNSSAHKKGGRL